MVALGPKATFTSWLTEIDAANGHPLAARVDLAMANHTIPAEVLTGLGVCLVPRRRPADPGSTLLMATSTWRPPLPPPPPGAFGTPQPEAQLDTAEGDPPLPWQDVRRKPATSTSTDPRQCSLTWEKGLDRYRHKGRTGSTPDAQNAGPGI